MIEDKLDSLGLSKNETTIYLSLLRKKNARAGELIVITKLHRNLVYQALEKLIERGLVAKIIQSGVFVFEAMHPSHLLEAIDRQRMIAEEIIHELEEKEAKGHRDIKVYDGYEGFIQARRQSLQLSRGETVYALGVLPITPNREYDRDVKLWNQYHEKRIKKGIHFRALYDKDTNPEHVAFRNTQSLSQARYLPSNMKTPVRFEMYGDTLTIVLPKSGPVTFSLKSREAVEGMKQYFEYLWNQEVSVENGTQAIRHAFYDMLNELDEGEEYCVIGASDAFQQIMSSSFFETFHTKRIEKGVRVRMLTHADSLELVRQNTMNAGDPKCNISEFRIMKTGQSLPIQINLYRKKTILIVYGKNPCIMRFDRADVHELFQEYFNELWNQKTQSFEGFDGIKRLCESVIHEGEDLYLIAANGHLLKDHEEFYNDFTKQRVSRSLFLHALAIESVRGTPFSNLPKASFRYLPPGFEGPMVIWIFGSKVAHVLFQEPESIFLIDDARVAAYYRQYFNGLIHLSSK